MNFDDLTTSTEKIDKVYNIDPRPVGEGFFGEVRKAKLKNIPSKFFAIKTIDKQKIEKEMHILCNEVNNQKAVDHSNIVKFYETYQDEEKFHLV